MPRHLHLDFESFSLADLKKVGAYRYAFDPSTEILCATMALGDEFPVAWWQGMPDRLLTALEPYWDALEDPEVLIYAHNATMESSMCQSLLWKTWGIPCPDIRRFRCTISLANRAGFAPKLETLGEQLGLDAKKDNRGKALIKKFSILQPAKEATKHKPAVPEHRIFPSDDPEAFQEFVEYCRQDVRVEQGAAKKLAYFDTDFQNANYVLTHVINARGVPVNLPALRHAQKLIDEETVIVSEKFRQLTGVEVTQGAKILAWLHERGCHLDNLQAETVETFLEKWEGFQPICNCGGNNCDVDFFECKPLPLEVAALQLRQSISYAAVKKVATMLACAGPHDNRIRGMLNHHGAGTGRWSASLVQFHNMKRPSEEFLKETFKDSGVCWSEVAYKEICEGASREMLELCHGPVLEMLSSCIRHFVQDI